MSGSHNDVPSHHDRCWSSKQLTHRFLEEIGYEDIFNEDEVQEIQGLFDKTSDSINKSQQLLESMQHVQHDADQSSQEVAETKMHVEDDTMRAADTEPRADTHKSQITQPHQFRGHLDGV